MNYFEELNSINVNEKVEKKNGLTYLSWAFAWAELKKKHPTATYKIYEREDGCIYFTDNRTCWVKVSVSVPVNETVDARRDTILKEEIEHIEYLPVMDYKNKSIPLENITSMDVNKAIQRALTKAIARHGLGLYIYAGEDLPESHPICESCKKEIVPYKGMSPDQIAAGTLKTYRRQLCVSCANEVKKQKENIKKMEEAVNE